MKQIAIQDLKTRLLAAVAEAESGATIVITRHNMPVAKLMPASPPHVHRGKDVGTRGLKPALRPGSSIPYLDVLREDRGNR